MQIPAGRNLKCRFNITLI